MVLWPLSYREESSSTTNLVRSINYHSYDWASICDVSNGAATVILRLAVGQSICIEDINLLEIHQSHCPYNGLTVIFRTH
jgi:hypothetical protein